MTPPRYNLPESQSPDRAPCNRLIEQGEALTRAIAQLEHVSHTLASTADVVSALHVEVARMRDRAESRTWLERTVLAIVLGLLVHAVADRLTFPTSASAESCAVEFPQDAP